MQAPTRHEVHETERKVRVREHTFRLTIVRLVLDALAVLLLLLLFLHAHGWAQVQPAANQNTYDPVNAATRVNVVAGGAAGGTSSTFGAAFPATGTAIGASDGVNMQSLVVDASKFLKVNCAVGCAGGTSTPADTFTNPTTASLNMAFPMVWNGTTWDRLKGDATNGAYVNIKAATTVPVSGTFWQATQPVSGTFWQATQPVSWSGQTVTATQATGTNLHIVCDSGCASGGSTTPADTFTNPTTAGLSFSFGAVWNGTTWDRLYGDKTNGAFVNVRNAVALAISTWAGGTLGAMATYGTSPGAVLVPGVNAFVTNTVPVTGTFWQATQPVSGTFWQATQPVSGTVTTTPPSNASTNIAQVVGVAPAAAGANVSTDSVPLTVAGSDYGGIPVKRIFKVDSAGNIYTQTNITNASLAVTGTFWQATQPVSGTFWQATQPVSIASMPSTPVTGTFWQATQPVSIASMPSTPVTGTFWQSTQPVAGTLTDNNAAPAATNVGAMPAIVRTDYRGGTAATAGRLGFPDVGTDGLLHVATLPDTSIKRYRASSKFANTSTTDVWRISGNASNSVLVTYVSFTCTQTTASVVALAVIKRSAAASGGTPATVTNVPMDSNKAAASSVVQSFTGTGPTVGAAVGDVDDAQIGCMAPATTSPNDIYIGNFRQGPIVLRGVAEGLTLNLGGALAGGNYTVSVEWMEVTTITP